MKKMFSKRFSNKPKQKITENQNFTELIITASMLTEDERNSVELIFKSAGVVEYAEYISADG